MKKLLAFTLFCCAAASITSCSKSLNSPEKENGLNGAGKTVSALSADQTTSLLTSQTWVYYEYFLNFSSPSTSLAWKTNRTSNTINLSLNQVKFNTDFTVNEIDQNGTVFNGTWSYINNGTGVQVVNSQGTFASSIQSLAANRYEWLASNGSNYGVMVPKNQIIDTTGGRLQLLTAKTWFYQQYFTGFGQPAPSLVWKTNKSNSTLNLSMNVVKFNANGSYWEIDQNGNVLTGTWNFLNNQTQVQVHNSLGTFTSTIKVLGTDRYEWLADNGSNYGEMIH
jgi:hypothetical protein